MKKKNRLNSTVGGLLAIAVALLLIARQSAGGDDKEADKAIKALGEIVKRGPVAPALPPVQEEPDLSAKEIFVKAAILKKVQNERLEMHKQIVNTVMANYNAGTVDLDKVTRAQRDALRVSLDINDDPETRIKMLKEEEKSVKALIKVADDKAKKGLGLDADVLQAKALLLEVEAEILGVELKAELKPLLKRRLDALSDGVKLATIQYQQGKIQFSTVAQLQREAGMANLALCESRTQRIAGLKALNAQTVNSFKVADAKFQSGSATKIDRDHAEAIMLEVQIELLREELKSGAQK